MTRSLPDLRDTGAWIAWIRVAAVPFALLEVVVEHGNYPPRHEPWAWTITAVFGAGALAFLLVREKTSAAALAFDTAIVSNYVALYGFEPNSPVRQLLILVVIEAALRYGRRGAAWALASAPALGVFEWRAAERLDVPFDPGHLIFPIGLQLLVGLIVGSLAGRGSRGSK